jgi:uncharacterized membrane protein
VIVRAAAGLLVMATLWTLVVVGAPFLGIAAIYRAAGLVCHQLAERSFHFEAGPVAVCARCLGLYVGGILGLVLGIGPRPASLSAARARLIVAVAALPTVATLAAEWLFARDAGNAARFVAALPLSTAAAYAVACAISGERAGTRPS